jgi:hypothetical protein
MMDEAFRKPEELGDLIDLFYSIPNPPLTSSTNIIHELKTALINKKTSLVHHLLINFNPDTIPEPLQTSVIVQLLEIAAKHNNESIPLILAWTEVHQLFPKIGSKVVRADEISHNTLWLLLPQLSDNVLRSFFLVYDTSPANLIEHWMQRIQFFNEGRLLDDLEITLFRVFKIWRSSSPSSPCSFPGLCGDPSSFTKEGKEGKEGEEEENPIILEELNKILEQCRYHEAGELLKKLIRQVQGFAPIPSWITPSLDNYEVVMEKIEEQNETTKFKVLGPINPLYTCFPSSLKEEGNSRMLSCNCYNRNLLPFTGFSGDPSSFTEEEEETNFFTGECDICLKKIADVSHCVRKISKRGWKGVYCSWACVTADKDLTKCAKCKKDIIASNQNTAHDWEYLEYKHLGKYHRFCSSQCSEGYINQKSILLEIIAEQLKVMGMYSFST